MTDDNKVLEPIHEEWEKFVASMDGKKHGLTDAFKFAWKAATEHEREACAQRASVALLGTLQETSDRVLRAIRRGES